MKSFSRKISCEIDFTKKNSTSSSGSGLAMSGHMVDDQIGDDIDTGSIATVNHVDELIPVSGSGFKLLKKMLTVSSIFLIIYKYSRIYLLYMKLVDILSTIVLLGCVPLVVRPKNKKLINFNFKLIN